MWSGIDCHIRFIGEGRRAISRMVSRTVLWVLWTEWAFWTGGFCDDSHWPSISLTRSKQLLRKECPAPCLLPSVCLRKKKKKTKKLNALKE